eukprot:TRINITY_DN73906_c0_g1_i1.p1 TRINITY_DN73906_c0_g1~~TRINITY_DN73906_c0_g1_i1.p1  ORF type:complete len:901 (+),score=173.36 TRINITY_DN73906_c0_g1_i1:331-2703(+)
MPTSYANPVGLAGPMIPMETPLAAVVAPSGEAKSAPGRPAIQFGAVRISVVLASGDPLLDNVELEADWPIAELFGAAEEFLGKHLQAVVTPGGESLDKQTDVGSSGLRDGDVVTAVPKTSLVIYSTDSAFAALRSNAGSVTAWGHPDFGGDCSHMQGELGADVLRVYSNEGAFAALRKDGSVVAWGDPNAGGDCSEVSEQLQGGVQSICSSSSAFAAVKGDGAVVVWGMFDGSLNAVRWQLSSDVDRVCTSRTAFAALRRDGNVVTWGDEDAGGDSSGVQDELSTNDIVQVYATEAAFAAVKAQGSVVTWGSGASGGDSSAVEAQLSSGVLRVYSASRAFCALKRDGSVVAWGSGTNGGNCSSVMAKLKSDVLCVRATQGAFAALKGDGSVVTWGAEECGGTANSLRETLIEVPGIRTMDVVPNSVQDELQADVEQLCSNDGAFAAVKTDGSVVTWGHHASGGDCSSVEKQLLSGVRRISSTSRAFAAIKDGGAVVTWGGKAHGGDSSSARKQLGSGVDFVYSTCSAFAAVKNSGSVVTWGDRARGATEMPSSPSGAPRRSFLHTSARHVPGVDRRRFDAESPSKSGSGGDEVQENPAISGASKEVGDGVVSGSFLATLGQSLGATMLPPVPEGNDAVEPGSHPGSNNDPGDDGCSRRSLQRATTAAAALDSSRASSPHGSKTAASPSKEGNTPPSVATLKRTSTGRKPFAPTPMKEKKLSPEEIARRSDAFWATVEAELGQENAQKEMSSTSRGGSSVTRRSAPTVTRSTTTPSIRGSSSTKKKTSPRS